MCAEGCHACLQFALVHVASKSTINNMHAPSRMQGLELCLELEEPPEAPVPVGALVLRSAVAAVAAVAY